MRFVYKVMRLLILPYLKAKNKNKNCSNVIF